jgi:hypothetical protein
VTRHTVDANPVELGDDPGELLENLRDEEGVHATILRVERGLSALSELEGRRQGLTMKTIPQKLAAPGLQAARSLTRD